MAEDSVIGEQLKGTTTVIKDGHEIQLMDNEKIHRLFHPHWLSFYDLYLLWTYAIVLSLIFVIFGNMIYEYLGSPSEKLIRMVPLRKLNAPFMRPIPIIGNFANMGGDIFEGLLGLSMKYGPVVLWFYLLVIPGLIISIIRIEWKWIPLLFGVGLISAAITIYFGLNQAFTYIIAIILSIFGMLAVDRYRNAHLFCITNYRIITEVDFIGHKKNELGFDKINNLVLNQPFLGKIFNFGTIIPITASGLGMGADAAAVTVAAGSMSDDSFSGVAVTGERSIQVPRTRSAYALFGIENPKKVYDMISELMRDYSEAPYLKSISTDMKKLLEKNDKK